jgi:hypothetical protein
MEFIYRPAHYPGPVAIDMKPSEELKDYHKNSCIQYQSVEWGGGLRCITSNGGNVNMADELNRMEKEKSHQERLKLEDKAIRDILTNTGNQAEPIE